MGRLAGLGLALALVSVAGCGDDAGDGPSGTIGERYAASRDNLTDVACDCFGDLGYGSRGACIDDIGFSDDMAQMCTASTIDEVDGTSARFECLLDANAGFEDCVGASGCAGATECATSFNEATGICPDLADPVQQTFNSTLAECLGDDVMPGTCPEIMSNAGVGGTITGTTVGFADDYSFAGSDTCVAHGNGSPDVTVRWTAPADGSYAFAFNGGNTDFRAVLLTVASCDDLTLGACADGTNFGGIRVDDATAGGTVTFIVDGLAGLDSGNFQIDVTEPDPM